MTDPSLSPAPYLKPLAEVTEFNRPFFDRLRDHEFVVPRCRTCGHYHWVPYPACRNCLSVDLEWTPVSGAATLYTYTIVHRGPGAFGQETPYVVAMGELVERPRPMLVIATLIGAEPDTLRIGLDLEFSYEDVPSEHATVYHWTPSAR